ncbi:MAG: hypothetical protein QG622_1418 [Actinomycetota bacterium]|nr:hypothetical protein [Actinomycetota bacterium]
MTAQDPASFGAQVQVVRLGMMTLTGTRKYGSGYVRIRRTPTLIRESDPGTYQLVIQDEGANRCVQNGRPVSLGRDDLALYDSSHPYELGRGDGVSGWLTLTFSRSFLPLSRDDALRVCGERLDGGSGLGSLVSNIATSLVGNSESFGAADGTRLAGTFLDLLAIMIDEWLDARRTAALPASPRRALVLDAQAYIEAHLVDPLLSPGSVAAAHHVSTRSLNRAFQEEDVTVSGWIRARRLERCRLALVDPGQEHLSVHVIAARNGFPNAAHFSRAFQNAYGFTPQECRKERAGKVARATE